MPSDVRSNWATASISRTSKADLHDGVLTIRIPVAEQAKPRKVEIGQSRHSSPDAIETTAAGSS